ncbi:MAG: hypothetical protein LBT50_10625 [Prevotellaceae bacterium]|jgi:hypothetical protein|nr:hypothetical protein [Prevotellaceae bacterium]
MNKLSDIEKRDIQSVSKDRPEYSVFATLSEQRRTATVSLVAVSAYGYNLEYVPREVKNRAICREALKSKDVDCDILSHIPFPDIQREGIKKFAGIDSFTLYSFVDINDSETAKDAVKSDGYCLQLVPRELLTEDLCKTAILHSNADIRVLDFIPKQFFTPEVCKTAVKTFKDGFDKIPKDKQTSDLLLFAKNERPKKNQSKKLRI